MECKKFEIGSVLGSPNVQIAISPFRERTANARSIGIGEAIEPRQLHRSEHLLHLGRTLSRHSLHRILEDGQPRCEIRRRRGRTRVHLRGRRRRRRRKMCLPSRRRSRTMFLRVLLALRNRRCWRRRRRPWARQGRSHQFVAWIQVRFSIRWIKKRHIVLSLYLAHSAVDFTFTAFQFNVFAEQRVSVAVNSVTVASVNAIIIATELISFFKTFERRIVRLKESCGVSCCHIGKK